MILHPTNSINTEEVKKILISFAATKKISFKKISGEEILFEIINKKQLQEIYSVLPHHCIQLCLLS